MDIMHDALLDHDTAEPADYVNRSQSSTTDPIRILATVAACYDAADHTLETADPTDPDTMDRDELARLLAYRVMSTADRLARSAHTWWHADRVDGDADPVAPAPDPFERVRSKARPTRTRKGRTTSIVDRHGRAYVVGSAVATPSPECTMSTARLTHALDTAPRAMHGVDGIALSRITAVAYPDLPRLVGVDTVSWEEMQEVHAVRVGKYRPTRWPSRNRLTTVRPRKGETARVDYADGQSVARLVAPSTGRHILTVDPDTGDTVVTVDPAEYAWRGHTLTRRPDTVRVQRKARARKVDRAVTVKSTAVLADTLAGIAAVVPTVPYRVTWAHTVDGEHHDGTLTVSGSTDKPRYSVTGLPSPVRNYATVDGLRDAIDRATA